MASNSALGNPSGDGLLCVTGQTARSDVHVTFEGSTSYYVTGGSPLEAWNYGPGVTTNYPFWYRDADNPCRGSGFNFTNAWCVVWNL